MTENGNRKDFLEECNEFFGSKNLYEVLGVEKTAKLSEIKSAYRKKSLKVHPDRVPEDKKEYAKRAFQALTKVHYVLTNENLRNVYDETGIVMADGDDQLGSFATFEEHEAYWRTIFPKITTKQIDDFFTKYIGSEEEKTDLKDLYARFEGDLDKISEYHFTYGSPEDEERIVSQLNELIEAEEIPAYDAFVKEPKSKKQKRIKRMEKERQRAARAQKKRAEEQNDVDEQNGDDISALQLAIQQKNKSHFDDMLAGLEAKYGSKGKKKPRRK